MWVLAAHLRAKSYAPDRHVEPFYELSFRSGLGPRALNGSPSWDLTNINRYSTTVTRAIRRQLRVRITTARVILTEVPVPAYRTSFFF